MSEKHADKITETENRRAGIFRQISLGVWTLELFIRCPNKGLWNEASAVERLAYAQADIWEWLEGEIVLIYRPRSYTDIYLPAKCFH